MRHCLLVFITIVLWLLPISAFSHGTEGRVEKGGLVVTALYDSGEGMSYAKVEISAPGAKLPFQSGRTDRNGRFCFFPDSAGEWKVTVDDEMGHLLEVRVPVDEQLAHQTFQGTAGPERSGLSRTEKALMGICIIFGLCGFFFWWKGRRHAPGLRVKV
jgi:nickel transport protein